VYWERVGDNFDKILYRTDNKVFGAVVKFEDIWISFDDVYPQNTHPDWESAVLFLELYFWAKGFEAV
jgi:hypothetical protein